MRNENNPNKKTPPAKETSFSVTSLPEHPIDTSKHSARFPGYLLNPTDSTKLRRSTQLLLLLLLKSDWKTGVFRTMEYKLAQQLSVTDRTIRSWLRDLEDYGVTTRRLREGIEIKLPSQFIPDNQSGKTNTPRRKYPSTRPENTDHKSGKNTVGLQSFKDAITSRYGFHDP